MLSWGIEALLAAWIPAVWIPIERCARPPNVSGPSLEVLPVSAPRVTTA